MKTVESVDIEQYMGLWYEIGKLPNSFERGLSCVTAEYSLLDNGKVRVINKGLQENGEVKVAKGKAKVVDKETNSKLKVTFFWPFYGDYWILKLDKEYQHVLIGSPNKKYLWVLSRTRNMSEDLYQEYLSYAKELGFDISKVERNECAK